MGEWQVLGADGYEVVATAWGVRRLLTGMMSKLLCKKSESTVTQPESRPGTSGEQYLIHLPRYRIVQAYQR